MASRVELRTISKARLKSAQILIVAKDWDGAAQMMGLALECALKAAICKSLNLASYPEKHPDGKFFMCHVFERLLLLSGMSEMFSAAGNDDVFNNWSAFVGAYPGEWVGMRYNDPQYGPFDQVKIETLFKCLYGDTNGLIRVIARNKKW